MTQHDGSPSARRQQSKCDYIMFMNTEHDEQSDERAEITGM